MYTHKMYFGMTVFTYLGDRHSNNFAYTRLEHDMSIVAKSRALHWTSNKCPKVSSLKMGVLNACYGGYFLEASLFFLNFL
jgi:hypothetical protein